MDKSNPKIFLTPTALASRWELTPSTLSQWRWNGNGPPYHKMGKKKILYKLEEIERFEANNLRSSTSQISLGKAQDQDKPWFRPPKEID